MEVLKALEERVSFLIDIINSLKEENIQLVEEKRQLVERLSVVEHSLMKEDVDKEKLYREKKLTKTAVDSLIERIDLLVKNENGNNDR